MIFRLAQITREITRSHPGCLFAVSGAMAADLAHEPNVVAVDLNSPGPALAVLAGHLDQEGDVFVEDDTSLYDLLESGLITS